MPLKVAILICMLDYTGTIYGSILGLEPNSDVDEVYRTVNKNFNLQFNLTVLDALGFNNTYTLAKWIKTLLRNIT